MSSAADVLAMSVVRGTRGVGGVCEMCMCLVRGSVGGEWIRGVDKRSGFGLYQTCGNRGIVGCVSVFGLRCCVWFRWGVGWCYICVSCESGLFV